MASSTQTREPMTPREAEVLAIIEAHISRRPDLVLRQVEIAKKLKISAPRVHEIVRSLARKRYIKGRAVRNLARAI